MSGALNGLKPDHSSSWPAAVLQWHSAHSVSGPTSSVSAHHHDKMASGSFPTTTLVIIYIIGFIIAARIIFGQVYPGDGKTANWDLPWVPAVTRRDAAAMPFFPVFLLLPAILWPLVVAGFVLVLAVSGLCVTLGSATSCCGIPLPRKKEAESGGSSETAPDLEMGAVAVGEDGGAPGGGGEDVGSDRTSELSSASAESERPPPYASVAPDEDGEGETDGLLAKGTI